MKLFVYLIVSAVVLDWPALVSGKNPNEPNRQRNAGWEDGEYQPRMAMTMKEAVITNDRYQNEKVPWGAPKGMRYGNLPSMVSQKANLYPDGTPTYFIMDFVMAPKTTILLTCQYPHSRYMSFTITNELGGNPQYILGQDIVPDQGSSNPFWPSNERNLTNRNYTLHIVQGDVPFRPASNTLYTNTTTEQERTHLSMRVYLVDEGWDGTGNVRLDDPKPGSYGLPQVTVTLEEKQLVGDNLLKILRVEKKADPNGYTRDQWLALVAGADDTVNAPVLPEPVFQLFWNTDYSVTGMFLARDPEQRVVDYPPSTAGGFRSNPNTYYQTAIYSFSYGDMFVIRGKLPTHPKTRRGETRWVPEHPEVQYFSVTTGGSPCSGEGYDTVYDEQIQVNDDGFYTIVVSVPWNKPSKEALNNGTMWLDPGVGEGHYIGARSWVGLVYIRFQNPSLDWEESPANVPMPSAGQPIPLDREVMQDYYPLGKYMSVEQFEKKWPTWF